MKCDRCKTTISETILKKIIGTYLWKNGKKRVVCRDCQQQCSIEQLREQL